MKTCTSPLAGIFLLVASAALADQTVNVGPGIAFSPSTVNVVPGETVTWVWAAGSLPHSTTSDSQSGPEVWDSGILTTGSFAHTFQTPGSYPFHCVVHSFPGGTMMNGTVVVAAPTPSPTPTAPPSAGTPTLTPPPVPSQGPGGPAAIPTFSVFGRLALGLALAVAAILVLAFARPS